MLKISSYINYWWWGIDRDEEESNEIILKYKNRKKENILEDDLFEEIDNNNDYNWQSKERKKLRAAYKNFDTYSLCRELTTQNEIFSALKKGITILISYKGKEVFGSQTGILEQAHTLAKQRNLADIKVDLIMEEVRERMPQVDVSTTDDVYAYADKYVASYDLANKMQYQLMQKQEKPKRDKI